MMRARFNSHYDEALELQKKTKPDYGIQGICLELRKNLHKVKRC